MPGMIFRRGMTRTGSGTPCPGSGGTGWISGASPWTFRAGLPNRGDTEGPIMKIVLDIRRFNPQTDRSPSWQSFELEVLPGDRLLDTLLHVSRVFDPTLGFRKSCGHGICGSDAMVINGKERLACKTLIKDVAEAEGAVVSIEPLRTLAVENDLMVDQRPFFAHYRKVKPFFINSEPVSGRERLQTPEERSRIDDPTKCILCAACYSACPVRQEKNP